MAYSGTTAATSVSNPPVRIGGRLGGVNAVTTSGGGPSLWLYNTSDESTLLAGTAYFTDAKQLGMKTGDVLIAVIATGSSIGIAIGTIGIVTTAGGGFASTGSFTSSSR